MNSRRFFPLICCASAVFLLTGFSACSVFRRHRAEGKDAPPPGQQSVIGTHKTPSGLSLELKSSPDPVLLGEVRQIEASVVLYNESKRPVTLKFASGQTIEILLRELDGNAVVSQWSTDRMFTQGEREIVLNPRERIEYHEPITTRELHAGKTYNLEAYFVGHEKELHVSRPIIPQR